MKIQSQKYSATVLAAGIWILTIWYKIRSTNTHTQLYLGIRKKRPDMNTSVRSVYRTAGGALQPLDVAEYNNSGGSKILYLYCKELNWKQ